MKEPKPKKCRVCKSEFRPFNSTAVVCSPKCAITLVQTKKAKATKQKHLEFKRKVRADDKSYWKQKAQESFNRYIRERDKDDPCICCGNYYGGQYHAGHYLSVGARPDLRFNEDNCHKQKSSCNSYKSGNQAMYRANLIKKIGAEKVVALERVGNPKRYRIEDFKAIKKEYDAKYKELRDGDTRKQNQ